MTMNIEWWMIDGAVALIVLIAALRGAVRGVGDTIIRILCIVGGIGLGIFYKDKLSAYLMTTKMRTKLYDRFFILIRGDETAVDPAAVTDAPAAGVPAVNDPAADGGSVFDSIFTPDGQESVISRSIGNLFDDAADRAADAAAERLTEIAMGVIAFALIILAVCIVMAILRGIVRHLRDTSIVIGFADRVLGIVLGSVRGLMLAWIAVALLIPVTTLVSPDKVTPMMDALQHTSFAKIIYDVNPLLLIVKYVFK